MAKGREQHEERMQALNRFGKDLARRAKSRCEVCEEGGVSLSIYEVPPAPKSPDFDHCLLACERCREALDNEKKRLEGEEWRCLAQTIWSEVPAVQVVVVRLLRRLAVGADWARETLEESFLDEEVMVWADKPGT